MELKNTTFQSIASKIKYFITSLLLTFFFIVQSGLVGIHDPVQECNDQINNRGCVKQFVNGGNIDR